MSNFIYALTSRQTGLDREFSMIANNIANASTHGYRRGDAIFTEFVFRVANGLSLSESRLGASAIGEDQGEFIQTGAPLDVAIEGPGWFKVETPQGERLTRAGSFTRNADGFVTTKNGYAVVGDGGPINIPQSAARIVIALDGTITADGAPIGRISIFSADPTQLSREGDALFRWIGEISPIETPKMRQGFVEGSNVNAVAEIARLIEVQRAFEMSQQLINDEHNRIKTTVDSLGPAR